MTEAGKTDEENVVVVGRMCWGEEREEECVEEEGEEEVCERGFIYGGESLGRPGVGECRSRGRL